MGWEDAACAAPARPGSTLTAQRRWGRAAAYAAAALAGGYAVVSLYWALGGRGLLSTVGGWAERAADRGGAGAVALGLAVAAAKVVGAALALAVAHPPRRMESRRRVRGLAWVVGALLVLYGGVLVVAGALVLTGAVVPSTAVDRTALRWHVCVWDLWFLAWGLLLLAATFASAGRRPRLPGRR